MSRRINYVTPADDAYRKNPIRLTVEGTYLSPEHYIMLKSKCEKFVEDLLADFDDVEFGSQEEVFTRIETKRSIARFIRGED